jgi:serine/threonine-protein kinase
VKILDFGIAKLVASDGVARTQTGSLLGTPLYMSPEQCRGTGLVDHRADIYALGCIVFELVAGRPPFVREGAGDLIVAHVSEEPPRLSSLVPGVSAALDQLVMQMLAKAPNERPGTMKEVGALLRAAWADRPVGRTVELPGTGPAAMATAAAAPAHGAPLTAPLARTKVLPGKLTTLSDTAAELASFDSTSPRGRRWLPAAAGVSLLAAAAVAFAVLRRPEPRAERSTTKPTASSRSAPEAPTPATVSIAIASSPAGAQVWVDDEASARGQTPLSVTIRKGQGNRALRLTLDGYLPKTLVVASDRDNAVAVALDAAPAPVKPQPRPRPKKPRSRAFDEFRKMDE